MRAFAPESWIQRSLLYVQSSMLLTRGGVAGMPLHLQAMFFEWSSASGVLYQWRRKCDGEREERRGRRLRLR